MTQTLLSLPKSTAKFLMSTAVLFLLAGVSGDCIAKLTLSPSDTEVPNLLKEHKLPKGELKRQTKKAVRTKSNSHPASNDPIRFEITSNKQTISIGEEIELSVTASLLDIPASSMFFLESAKSYSIKVILPPGFEQTGGNYSDYIGDDLSLSAKPSVTYTIKGRFVNAKDNSCFRLLRSHKFANEQSTFVEKSKLCVLNTDDKIRYTKTTSEKTNNNGNGQTIVVVSGGNTGSGSMNPILSLNGDDCTPFAQVCSGNQYEVRNQSINVASSATYTMTIHYNATERDVTTDVLIDGSPRQVTFTKPNPTGYQDLAIANVYLTAGPHTIGLSSGPLGGYICFDKICLSGGGTPPPGCAFTPTATVSNASPGCGASVNLSASCAGADCNNGVSYVWSGNGINQSGQMISVNAPTSNGSYSYTVTASKSGCTPQTATTNLTVSGCGGGQATCTPFAQVCSGNQNEVRNQSINVASSATYTMTIHYNATERDVTTDVLIDGSPRQVTFTKPNPTGYQDLAIANVYLTAGPHTIGLSSGPLGGYICFDKICLSGGGSTTPDCFFTPTATVSNATPGCGASVNLSASCAGADCNSGVSYVWSGNGINQSGQMISVNAPTSNGSYSYTVTASKSGCTPQTQTATTTLTVSGCVVSCAFMPTATVSNATPGCGASVNLSASCAGADCNSGVSYVWSGNGINQSGQTISVTVPSSNGSYSYTVTASKSGCTPQTATTNLTVSGCGNTNYLDMGRAGTRRDQFDVNKLTPQNGTVAISDVSNYNVSGYNTLYFVNDVYIGMTLSNYPLPVNAKYVVDKLITKSTPVSGYQRILDLYKHNYLDPQWINSWHQQIIDTYDQSTPIVSEQSIDGGKGILLTPYQEWFVKTNNWNYQAVKDGPAQTSPAGKVYGGVPMDGKGSIDDYHSHGWNMIDEVRFPNNGPLIPNNERLAYPKPGDFKQALVNSGQPSDYSNAMPSYTQGRTAQDYSGYNSLGWLIDQLQDGEPWVSGESDGYLGYHERFKEINPNSRTFGSYGQSTVRYQAASHSFQPRDGGPRNPQDNIDYLRLYQSQQEARTRRNREHPDQTQPDAFYQFHDGKTLSSIGVGQLFQLYPYEVNEIDLPFVKMHEMDVMLKQDPNNRPLAYIWPFRENPVGNPIPSGAGDASSGTNSYIWEHETTSPAGKVRQGSHSTCSLILSEAVAFDGMVRGTGIAYFHNTKFSGNNRNLIGTSNLYTPDWIPDSGSPSNFPFVPVEAAGIAPLSPLVGFDATYQGRAKALRVFNWLGTTTPSWAYASYSLNGVTRTAPADGSAILNHAADYKPMAMVLSGNGKKAVWAFDPYCQPNATQTMSVNLGDGTSVNVTLKGNALHVILIN